jgi:hypothetical protein
LTGRPEALPATLVGSAWPETRARAAPRPNTLVRISRRMKFVAIETVDAHCTTRVFVMAFRTETTPATWTSTRLPIANERDTDVVQVTLMVVARALTMLMKAVQVAATFLPARRELVTSEAQVAKIRGNASFCSVTLEVAVTSRVMDTARRDVTAETQFTATDFVIAFACVTALLQVAAMFFKTFLTTGLTVVVAVALTFFCVLLVRVTVDVHSAAIDFAVDLMAVTVEEQVTVTNTRRSFCVAIETVDVQVSAMFFSVLRETVVDDVAVTAIVFGILRDIAIDVVAVTAIGFKIDFSSATVDVQMTDSA